ncbi:protein Tob2 isoform X2 [Enoplosus armatus]|uniref:protein Tob2 isoform X2 n=1 Tax=Enoplosus armatus TaxID=215367 RepID=UPI003992B456
MHLEVKVALNFIVSYLYNKLPRRRADLFGEELERILMSRFEGHWYPEAPLRGSAFRCIHLGAPRDPVVELAAKRSGLDTEEVRANVPAELSVWIDPYEVSYQIGEKGAVKVLYLEDPPGLGYAEAEEAKSLGFNPDAQVFVPIGSQASPALLPSLSSSPTPLSPPSALPTARPQPITFTTASFAATKFGSTKMKKCSGAGSAASSAVVIPPAQRMLSRSPTTISAPELLKHKPLSLSLHSLGGTIASQLSPNAKEFVYPGSPGPLYFDADTQPMQPHASPFQPPHTVNTHPSFDPFSSPPAAQSVGIIGSNGGISYMEKPPFVEGLGSYNLQYPSQSFQPVVLAN